MFKGAPSAAEWQAQLAGQTRLTVTAAEALEAVRSAWAAAVGEEWSQAPTNRHVLERARIGRSGVGLSRVVFDLLERKGFELRGEFAQSPGVLQQWA